jgi:hypothetical protein
MGQDTWKDFHRYRVGEQLKEAIMGWLQSLQEEMPAETENNNESHRR